MPEGDTIHRLAGRLAPVLEGRPLERFEARLLAGARPRRGETIDRVGARGKHLVVDFSGGLTLDTHLGMSGSWRVRPSGAGPGRDGHLVRVHLGVPEAEVYCLAAPTVRTFPTTAVERHLGALSPDLAAPDPDLGACLRRWAALAAGPVPLVDVLRDQRIAAGVGNVFVSEVGWHTRHHPMTPSDALAEEQRLGILAEAARLLRANLGPGPRRTVAGSLAAYGRRGRPCRRCGAPIRSGRLGRPARPVFWCPRCQPEPGPGPAGYPLGP